LGTSVLSSALPSALWADETWSCLADGQAAVEDLQSKNGTSVQNQPIAGPTILADGDEIEFGHVKGWFIVEDAEDPPTTTHL
jgi:pSer/pThr/pTyr-binding forkhead associated (FHA) protein